MNIGDHYNPHDLFYGVHIPTAILRHPCLSPTAKLLFGRLARYAGKDGLCYPSQNTLAEELGTSRSVIQDALKRLEEYKVIEKITPTDQEKGEHRSTVYKFTWAAFLEQCAKLKKGCRNPASDDRNPVNPMTGIRSSDNKGSIRESFEENHPPNPPVGGDLPSGPSKDQNNGQDLLSGGELAALFGDLSRRLTGFPRPQAGPNGRSAPPT